MKLKELLDKVKRINNVEIIIAVILCVIVVVICFIDFPQKDADSEGDLTSYIAQQQRQIEKLLGKIDGVGNISVAITYTSGIEQVFAYNTTTQTKNEVTTTTSEIIMIADKPLVAQELLPKISGVVVVMQGDAAARIKVIEALKTLLLIDSNQIKVYNS